MRIAPCGFIHSIAYVPAHKEVVRKESGIDQVAKMESANNQAVRTFRALGWSELSRFARNTAVVNEPKEWEINRLVLKRTPGRSRPSKPRTSVVGAVYRERQGTVFE
jgi:hypothetical protein